MQWWIFSRRIQNRWSLASVGTCRKNRIRRFRATTRRKGCVLEKARLSPTTRRVRDTRERRRDLPLRGYLPRDKDDEHRRRYQWARGERKERRVDLDSRRRTRRDERAGVCIWICRCTRLQRMLASAVEGRESESEGEESGRGAERECDVRRGRERETGRKREEALPPPRGVKTTPRARGVSGLGAETNRARPKRAQCPTHTRSRTAHD